MKKHYSVLLISILCIAKNFTFAQPTITNFTPTTGPIGTAVTITGTNFNTTPANNIVFFGATMATVNTASATSLNVTVPAGASYQYISITDIVTKLTVYSLKPFNVTFTCGGIINSASFLAKTDFVTGQLPMGIAISDLDGDGKPEIVSANMHSNTVSVFRNIGTSGTINFSSKVDYTTGSDPYSVAIGDVDGDGKQDIVVTNSSSNTVSILKNISTSGIISFNSKLNFSTGTYPYNVAIGDIDGDGKLDLAVANISSNNISVLRNTSSIGNIAFDNSIDFATDNGADPSSVAIGDLDGDSKPDLTVGNRALGILSIFGNTSTSGTISFAPKISVSAKKCNSVALGDLDGDGKTDIALANWNNDTVSVLRNTSSIGAFSFDPRINFETTNGGNPYGVAIGDMDGDNKPDLMVANDNGVVSTFKNNSTSGVISYDPKTDFYVNGGSTRSIAIGDLDEDGKLDVALAFSGTSAVSTLRNLASVIPAMTSVSTATICNKDTVIIPLTSDLNTTYTWLASDNPSTIGESITMQTTDTLSNVIINNSTSVQIVTYTVTPIAPTNSCTSTGLAQIITVTVNPSPVVSFSGLNSNYCSNTSAQTLIGTPTGGAFNGAGISGNLFTPSVASPGTHIITYTYTDTNGCTDSSSYTTNVLPLPLAPAICMVTTDSLSKNNIIVWDKTTYTRVDSFIVYREISTNNYKRIGAVPFDSLSEFVDTVRTKYFPNTGDPNAGTYRYKLQIRDTCGNYSPLSPYHNTIFITNTNGSFSWTQLYTIESASNPVNSYVLMRDDNSNGNWHAINSVSGTQQNVSDPAYTSFQNTASWRVETFWSITCTPTRSFNTSLSNKRTNTNVSVNSLLLENRVKIYPTLNNGKFIIEIAGINKMQVEIYSTLGELVYRSGLGNEKSDIDLSDIDKGVYLIHLISDKEQCVKRIIIGN